jgi:PTH1 family peptidyl-tRNA hydrolase
MLLIIGLGNPGEKYGNTRHNIGFMFLEKIRKKYDFPDFEFNKKFKTEISEKNINGGKIILCRPQTFMNLSGEAVRNILNFYKSIPADILVIHDDLDIEIGKYKFAEDSSSAGHNGVQNIIDNLGTQKFRRIRIGIANSDLYSKISPENFVLQKFSPEDKETIEKISEEVLKKIKGLN